MDREEAIQFLGGGSTTNTATQTTNAPASNDAFLEAGKPELQQRLESEERGFLERTQEPGVPLDTDTGVSPWERLMLSFRRDRNNQVAYLQKKYGPENIRLSERGDLIVRVLSEDTKKPKDIFVDEPGLSAKDLIDVAGVVPEIASAIIAMRAGRGSALLKNLKGLPGAMRDVVTSGVGAETAGFVKDVGANIADTGQPDIAKTAKERGAMLAGDIGVGAALYPAGKLFQYMESPLHGARGPVQFDLLAAQKNLESKSGVRVPLTVGESTGSPFFSRSEVFVEKQPGGSVPFVEFRRKQEDALRRLQAYIMGKEPVPDEELGKRLMAKFTPPVTAAESAVAGAQSTVRAEAENEIAGILSKLTGPERQLYRTQAGKDLREAIVSQRDAAKAEADALFGKVKSLPGGEGTIFEADGLQNRFADILKKLPSPESVTEVPTGVLGPSGEPILRTETGKEVLREFVPPNVLARLKSVVDLKDAKFSLSDLQQMRREVYDDIARGEGVPGLGTHYLNDIGKAITAVMEEGIAKLPTSELKTALLAANKHYKEKVVPFNRIGLTELFRDAYDAGNISDSQVLGRIFSGERATHNYQLVKEVLGEKSPQFIKAKRAIADQLLESSKVPGEETLDAKAFIKTLASFREAHPDIAEDLFGKDIGRLITQSKFINYSVLGDKVPEEELAKLLADKTATRAAFADLLQKQGKLDAVYRNSILKMISEGELKNVNPSELVGRFLNSEKVSPAQIKDLMASVFSDARLTEDVQAKMVESIFRGAARSATPSDINRLLSGDPTRLVSGTGIFKQLESPAVREKVEAVLGADRFKDLLDYLRIEAARELKETSFKSAGGISAGAQIASITKRGPLQYLDSALKNWVVAKTLTNDRLRGWLTRVPAKDPASVSLLFASTPFVQAVAREYGSGDAADSVMSSIKHSVDRWVGDNTRRFEQDESESRRKRFEQFLESGQPSLQPAR